jgi:hypothetical protein
MNLALWVVLKMKKMKSCVYTGNAIFSQIFLTYLLTPIGGFQTIGIPNKEGAISLGVTRSVPARLDMLEYETNSSRSGTVKVGHR